MQCRINRGAGEVLAPNYKDSPLFNNIQYITNDFNRALDVYAFTEHEDFKRLNPPLDENGEPSLQTLMNFVNLQGESKATKKDVISFMQSAKIFDSGELLKALSKIEISGVPVFSVTNLVNTKIFSNFEAELIARDNSFQKNITEVLKYLRQNSDFEITETGFTTNGFQLTSGKNQVERNLPDDKAYNVGNKRTSVGYTLRPNESPRLSENISFLLTAVTEETWSNKPDSIKQILKEVEDKSLDLGIDVRGLSETYDYRSMEDVLDMVDAIDSLLTEELTTDQFDSVVQEFFDDGFKEEYREINEETDVILTEEISEDEAFERGFIKISDDVVRRVPNIEYSELLLIQSELEGIDPIELDKVVNQNYDRGLVNGKQIYLLKRNLGVSTSFSKVDTSSLDRFSGDFEYLTEDFISDFLKVADMEYFNIDFRGITFKDDMNKELALTTLDSETLSNLEQYSLLSPYISMPYTVETVNTSPESLIGRMKAVLSPTSVPLYKKDFVEFGDVKVIKNRNEQFLNINGKVNELVNREGNLSFYKDVNNFEKPVMESNVFDFTQMVTKPKKSTQHKVQNTEEIKDKYFNC